MKLHQRLRTVNANGANIVFSNAVLQSPMGPAVLPAVVGDENLAPSVLLRTAALFALTKTEHANANANSSLKIAPAYDCLFPFSNNGNSFPSRSAGRIDLIIANNEFGVLIAGIPPTAPTEVHYQDFMTANAGIDRAATALGQADLAAAGGNIANTVIPIDDENLTPTVIFNNYNDNQVNLPNITFFDEVNAVHNNHRELARINISALRNLDNLPKIGKNDRTFVITTLPNAKGAITLTIQRTGAESTLVDNWGPYTGLVRDENAFINVRNHFRNGHALTPAGTVMRDLYRLECIREPAVLLTHPMFLDLAANDVNAGYKGIGNKYKWTTLTTRMPMAQKGATKDSRSLWRYLINSRAANNPIYYRYDYTRLDGLGQEHWLKHALEENNLLFNWLMMKADAPVPAGGDGGVSYFLKNSILGKTRAQQIANLNAAALWVQQPFVLTDIYQRTVNIGGGIGNIIFEARFPLNAHDEITNINIHISSFPLALINQLLLEWYNVDIGLPPNQIIEIDLYLKK